MTDTPDQQKPQGSVDTPTVPDSASQGRVTAEGAIAGAIVHADGSQKWYVNGQQHRTDGPAI